MPNPQNKIIFTNAQKQFLRDNYMQMTNVELAKAVGQKQTVVRMQLYKMGCKKFEKQHWTPAQVEFLKENYKTIGDVEIADLFDVKYHKVGGWSRKHIEKKRRYLNLKRTPAETERLRERNRQKGCWKHVFSWSSANQAKVGELRVNFHKNVPILKIKTPYGFKSYSRWLYKKHKGNIPKGMKVRIMSGDRLNFTIDDLQLVTNAENGALNSISRTPPELQKLTYLQNKLKNLIIKTTRNDRRNIN
jgi:hypothetical protein